MTLVTTTMGKFLIFDGEKIFLYHSTLHRDWRYGFQRNHSSTPFQTSSFTSDSGNLWRPLHQACNNNFRFYFAPPMIEAMNPLSREAHQSLVAPVGFQFGSRNSLFLAMGQWLLKPLNQSNHKCFSGLC